MKKFLKIFSIIIVAFLILTIVAGWYYFSEKNIKAIIAKQFYEKTGDNISINSIKISFNKGVGIHIENIIIFSKKNNLGKISTLSANLSLSKILKKTVFFNKLTIKNGYLDTSFIEKLRKKTNTPSSATKKHYNNNKKNNFSFYFKNIFVDNFIVKSNISHKKVKLCIKKLRLTNFSLSSNLKFDIDSTLIVDKSQGKIVANGNIFIPQNKINAKINANNLNLDFLKKFGISISNFNINGKISGNLKKNIFSHLNISAQNIEIPKVNNLHFNNINIDFKFSVKDKIISISNSLISIDNNVKLSIYGTVSRFKNIDIVFNSNQISTKYLKHFIPKNFPVYIMNNGNVKLEESLIKGEIDNLNKMQIFSKFSLDNISAKFKNFTIKNLSLQGSYNGKDLNVKNIKAKINNTKIEKLNVSFKNKTISGNGKFKINLSDIPEIDKFLTLHKGIMTLNLKNFSIPLRNFSKKRIKFSANFFMNNGLVSYDFFKKIKVNKFIGAFNEKIITLKEADVNFRGYNYKLRGTVRHYMVNPVAFDFDISSNIFDKFIAENLLKMKIGTCKNILANVHLKGGIDKKFKIELTKGNVKFFNSNVEIEGFKLKNINGSAFLKNNIVTINNISLIFNNGKYLINGEVTSPFKKKLLNINVQSNKIDKIITKILKINELTNIDVFANIRGSFNKIKLNSAKIKFHGTNIFFHKYKIKNIYGNLDYKNSVAFINNLKLRMNNINYTINGTIFYPFENLSYSINVKTDKIDSYFLKQMKINIPTIKNVYANINISGNLKKKLTFRFNNSIIKFKNTNINKYLKNISGKIILKNSKVSFENIKANLFKGVVEVDGFITMYEKVKNGYFKIYGENFVIPNFEKKSKKTKNSMKKKLKKEISNKKPHFLKKLHNFVQKLNIEISTNLKNIKTPSDRFKYIIFDLKLDKNGIFVKKGKLINYKNGFFTVEKGSIKFDKTKSFIIDIKYDDVNIGDIFNFFIPKKSFEFYGNAKNCYINIHSYFKKYENFEKNLNGKFNIFFKNGFINKVPMIANIFSILNIAQIFKFKLPDLSTKGFNYSSLKGDFIIKNGVISTESLKLDSDSINLIYFGKINLVKKVFNAHLAVYPLKTVDTVLRHIPLIGYLLKDRNGSGTLVTYFRIKGPLDKPSIAIQPAKTVTKKVESVLKNIIKLPFKIFTNPGDVLIPNTR